jgi:hypothetical protein
MDPFLQKPFDPSIEISAEKRYLPPLSRLVYNWPVEMAVA